MDPVTKIDFKVEDPYVYTEVETPMEKKPIITMCWIGSRSK